MKLKFKINLKESRIPELINVPKTLIETRHTGKINNFIEEKYLKKIYLFDYDKKNKVLKSIDNFAKHIHGVYTNHMFDLKKAKLTKDGIYTKGWFTGAGGRFVRHEWFIRHFVTFDSFDKEQVLVNKVGYFFKKDGDKDFKSFDESYVWMDLVK